MLKKSLRFVCLVCVLGFASATAFSAQAGELTVSAAASLTNAFGEVKDAFEKANPDIKITTNFAASNPLLKQIESGAPVDVFASADQATMDKAFDLKLMVAGSRVDFAANDLVLIVPAGESKDLKSATELTEAQYTKIAIGNPDSVPAGRYTREVLTMNGLWDKLESKFIMGESVRQVLDYVSRAEVQAGFVYATDAKQGGDKVRVVEVQQGKTRVTYPIAIVEASKNKKDAEAFIKFVTSDEGQAILAKYGFGKP